jgi:hypothetical protein
MNCESTEEALRRLHDIRDVIRAISVAARLLDDHIEAVESEMLDLLRRPSDKS